MGNSMDSVLFFYRKSKEIDMNICECGYREESNATKCPNCDEEYD